VLLTTQYLEEADRLADTLVVLDHGRVIAEGTAAQLKAELGATVLSVGFADEGDARRTVALLSGLGPHEPSVDGSRVEVTVDDGPTSAMESLRLLDREGLVPSSFALREPSLDDVFLALTGHRTEDEDGAEPDAATDGRRRGGGRRAPTDLVDADGRRPS
jgi:ABC-2 type transport system ATP-binding protein